MDRQVGKPRMLRELNASIVLDCVRQRGPVSRPELAGISGLSLPTINARVRRLLEAGYVREVGRTESHGGRPAGLVEFNAEFGYVVGIDVGGDKMSVALADLAGNLTAFEQRPMQEKKTARGVMEVARGLLGRVLDSRGVGLGQVMAAGLSIPGLVDPRGGDIRYVPNIDGWFELRPEKRLGDLIGKPIVIENNVNAAMEGEKWRGAARGAEDAVFVAIDRGVGAGVMVDGRLYRGHRGAAGEIGLQREFHDEEPLDGLFGPFERRASGTAIAGRYRELTGRRDPSVTVADVYRAAEAGDASARRVVEEATSLLAGGLVNLCAILAPELVVLGGSAASAGEALLEPLRRRLERTLPVPPRLAISELGDRAPVLGMIRSTLEVVDDEEFAFKL